MSVYHTFGTRKFRLSKGMRDRMLVRSGSLSLYPKGWDHDLLRIESLFTIAPTASGYRARLDFRPAKTLDRLFPDDRQRVIAHYPRLSRDLFNNVARQEVLAGLRVLYRRHDDLADRVEYQLAENAWDLSMALHIAVMSEEFPCEPVR